MSNIRAQVLAVFDAWASSRDPHEVAVAAMDLAAEFESKATLMTVYGDSDEEEIVEDREDLDSGDDSESESDDLY